MSHRLTVLSLFVVVLGLTVLPQPADAQLRRLRDVAQRAVQNEVDRKVATVVGDAVACTIGNRECVEEAQRNGEKVVIVDEDGEVITDENGNPITDPELAEASNEAPGEGRWANYDYLRGERPIYNTRWNVEDVDNPPALVPDRRVRVGRIPGNVEFEQGNMQIVQVDGLNTAEFVSQTLFSLPLAEPLPEDFSLEMTARTAAPNMSITIVFEDKEGRFRGALGRYEHHYVQLFRGGGIFRQSTRVSGVDQMWSLNQQLTPIKFQVDDGYAILYVGGERIAQVPNFSHPVGATAIKIEVQANQNLPAEIRSIRVDYGVEDPVAVFEAEGEYTTRSIFFDFNSANLRPESTPELDRILMMIEEYGQPVVIEGHTDAIGSDDYNLSLSGERAEAVKAYLVDNGVDAGLIETVGKGETEPVADNDTDDGRQANRRVVIRTSEM